MFKRVPKIPILVLAGWMAGLTPPAAAQALTASTHLMPRIKAPAKASNQKSLISVLADFEKQHQVSFNYDNELLSPILSDLDQLQGQANIDQKLRLLLAPHQLTFEKVSRDYIIIFPANPLGGEGKKPWPKNAGTASH